MMKKPAETKQPLGKRLKVEELGTKMEVEAKAQLDIKETTTTIGTSTKVTLKSFFEVGKIVSTTVGVTKSNSLDK